MSITTKFATLEEIQQGLTEQGVINLTDDSGLADTLNETNLQMAVYRAEGLMFGYIGRRYRSQLAAVSAATAPKLLKSIEIDLVGYFLSQRGGFQNRELYDVAVRQLEALRQGELEVWDNDALWAEESTLATVKIDFEPASDFTDWGDPGAHPKADITQHENDVIEGE